MRWNSPHRPHPRGKINYQLVITPQQAAGAVTRRLPACPRARDPSCPQPTMSPTCCSSLQSGICSPWQTRRGAWGSHLPGPNGFGGRTGTISTAGHGVHQAGSSPSFILRGIQRKQLMLCAPWAGTARGERWRPHSRAGRAKNPKSRTARGLLRFHPSPGERGPAKKTTPSFMAHGPPPPPRLGKTSIF